MFQSRAALRWSGPVAALAFALLLGGCYGHAHVRTGAHVSGHLVYHPPPARHVAVTVRPVAPYPNAVWVDGHWVWNGAQYVWYDGHYVEARSGHTYVQARWVQTSNGWRYHRGYWSPVRGAVHVHGHAGHGHHRGHVRTRGHHRGHVRTDGHHRGTVGGAVHDRHERRTDRRRDRRRDRRDRRRRGDADGDVRVRGSIGAEIR